ncbi:MAG: transposase [Raoultibacter sp.]
MEVNEQSSTQRHHRRVYPPEVKLSAVRAVIRDGMSYRQAAEKYGIASVSTLKKWLITYRKEGKSGLVDKTRGRIQGSTTSFAPVFDPLDPERGYRIRKENTRLVAKLGR